MQGRWAAPVDRVGWGGDRGSVSVRKGFQGRAGGRWTFWGARARGAWGVGAVVSPVGNRTAVPVLQRTHCLFLGGLGRRAGRRRFGFRRARRPATALDRPRPSKGRAKRPGGGWGGGRARGAAGPGPKEVSCWEPVGGERFFAPFSSRRREAVQARWGLKPVSSQRPQRTLERDVKISSSREAKRSPPPQSVSRSIESRPIGLIRFLSSGSLMYMSMRMRLVCSERTNRTGAI